MRTIVMLALAIVTLGCNAQATENPSVARMAEPTRAAEPTRIAGTVLETLDASSYTYLRFETPDGEAWAAVPRARLEIGDPVVLVNPQAMSNFESKTLGRSFETIYFGMLADPSEPSPASRGAATAPIEVGRAEGPTGRTVAELYAGKDDLAGRAVALRGKVVKYNADIMGRNWIHLQDGTGDAVAGTDDITVTSSGTTAVGEVVLVQGVVAIDKDFGAGYRYAVIVEEASLE